MTSRRWRLFARGLCGLALFPLLVWLVVVLVAPTGWARRRIVAELESRSGRRVALEGVSIGLMGGIRLAHLEIGSPTSTADPWLKADEIRLNFGPLALLGGDARPSRVEVEGAELRVLRRGDGTLELADLLRPVPAPRAGEDGRTPRADRRTTVRLRRGDVTVVDEPSGTRLRLQSVDGEGYAEGRLAVVEQLRGSVNGGELRFAGRIDRTESDLAAEARLRADDVALDDGMRILQYAVPVLAGAPGTIKGRLNADLRVRGRGPSWRVLCRDLTGRGGIALNRVVLDGTPMLAELSRVADLGPRRVGSVRTDFTYRAGRIATDRLTLSVGGLPIAMTGWTDLEGRIDYRVQISGLGDRLPDQARRLLSELRLDSGSVGALTVKGSLGKMVFELNGVPIDSRIAREPRLRPEDRQRLRLLGRQLRDELLK